MKIKRSSAFLIIFVISMFFYLSACGSSTQQTSSKNLTILEWAGYEKDDYHQGFITQHPDTKVDYVFMADDAESFAKAQNTPGLDLLHPCANYFDLFVKNNLVQPIDTSRIKDWDKIYPELRKMGEYDGKQIFYPLGLGL